MGDSDYRIKDFISFGTSYKERMIPGWRAMDIQSRSNAWNDLESKIKIKTHITKWGLSIPLVWMISTVSVAYFIRDQIAQDVTSIGNYLDSFF